MYTFNKDYNIIKALFGIKITVNINVYFKMHYIHILADKILIDQVYIVYSYVNKQPETFTSDHTTYGIHT